jgi:negative regulator of flagellin synthesis FlgM
VKVNNKAPQAMLNDKAIGDVKNNAVKKNKNDAAKTAEIMDATKLNLSPQARQVAKAKDIARDQSVDEAKIARLQKAIDSGTYKIDAEKIADKMVDEHLMLPS